MESTSKSRIFHILEGNKNIKCGLYLWKDLALQNS